MSRDRKERGEGPTRVARLDARARPVAFGVPWNPLLTFDLIPRRNLVFGDVGCQGLHTAAVQGALGAAAMVCAQHPGTYLNAKYRRIATRRGR